MLTDKMKSVLSPEDQTKLESAIKELVEQKTTEKSGLLVEQKEKELKTALEADYNKKLDEAVAAEKVKLEEQKKKDIEELEKTLVERLNNFLNLQIAEKISDESLEKIAVNETFKPIIEGIKSLFEDKYVDLDTEGVGILKEAKEEIESLNEKISGEIAEKISLKEENDKLKSQVLLAQKTKDLTESQVAKVSDFFSDKTLAETEKKIDAFIEMIIEREEAEDKEKKNKDLKENTDVVAEGDGIVEKEQQLIEAKKEEKTSTESKANSLL